MSGVLTLISTLLQSFPLLSLLILIAGRLLLGIAQGLIGVGTISWCMGQVGAEHTARSISWNGIASYGAIAIGAPLGVVMVGELGFASLGIALSVLALAALLLIRNKPSVPVIRGERLPFWAVFGRIAPFGASLSLASIGYGTLTTFITLYYVSRGWAGAAYCLTVFGVCFILARLLFISSISRFGGFTSAIACMSIETVGLVLLWLAPSTGYALDRRRPDRVRSVAGVSGAGGRSDQASAQLQSRSGIECLCGVFRSGAGDCRAVDGRGGVEPGVLVDFLQCGVVVGDRTRFDLVTETPRDGLTPQSL